MSIIQTDAPTRFDDITARSVWCFAVPCWKRLETKGNNAQHEARNFQPDYRVSN
ncbi:hypothetical protein RRH01S_28_00050 [Rhizobium rhizogenes NBRC 13257]|uniref:Uncharacterized protein n=1 Tax=Rhizobium rhizogenes NBRC 13257 TaxID=1220581 RepID=A0AA87Q7D3_RHIRH|nr:hypothetical protein RRH01S_28_00050 [Rhizobium rhizogenes NBRC 13257]